MLIKYYKDTVVTDLNLVQFPRIMLKIASSEIKDQLGKYPFYIFDAKKLEFSAPDETMLLNK